ncbi:TonB-dependent receptor plug domain-containing protein [Novosphingobium sp. KCTC 2891]|uniref:TonB-dependent receptor n=1 Tax=Novosphingobium sp. KCTC 2891 TaxID=2989730 RepID=UPI002222562B|nr:TonB-dependent receptor plug domain-containing protein [Novosphingobium sp. KCTC 2891]MCW1384893.1 TonB-dependent receptor plug domain-containing protein [Novosphingobium sp. KCTC 2891]
MKKLHALLACSAAFAPAALLATPAFAQESAAADAPAQDEIIVTARRRGEDIARVPTAVAAISADALAQRSITTQADLQSAVPGLTIRETQSNNNLSYSIRGQTIDAFSGSAAAVVPYINEVNFAAGGASNLYDIESVQVLKGPQGTLFGRNATGGAVLFTTTKPKNDLGGYISGAYGNYNYWEVKGALNVPIVTDKVLFRAAFDVTQRDGYIHNVYRNEDLGAVDRWSARGSLTLRPTDTLQNTTVFEYSKSKGNNTGTQIYSLDPVNTYAANLFSPMMDTLTGVPGAWQAYLAAHPKANPGGLAATLQRQKQLGFWAVDTLANSFHDGRDWYVTNTTTLDVTDTIQIKNIFGATDSYAHDTTSQKGTPYLLIATTNVLTGADGNVVKVSGISDELQLQGKAFGGSLNYILGAFYQKTKNTIFYPGSYFDIRPVVPTTGIPSVVAYDSNFRNEDETKAIFAHGTYDLSRATGIEGLSMSFGGRYTWVDVSLVNLPGSTYSAGIPEIATSFSKPSWNFGLEYQINPHVMAYVTTRGSWRSGGLNGVAPPVLATGANAGALFLSETAKDVEAGVKFNGRVMNRPAHLFIAAYNQWIDNVQRVTFPSYRGASIAVTANVPNAQVTGFEVDGAIEPTDWLELGGNLAYTNARFTNGKVTLFGNDYTFDTYPDTPKWSGSAYVQITLPVPESMGKVRVRSDVYAQTSQWFSNFGIGREIGTNTPGYALVNARLDWTHIQGTGVTASVFGRNLFNKGYYVGGLAQGIALGANSTNVGRPRMYGVELKFEF